MKEFWNDRYSSEEYIYGDESNEFLKAELKKLSPGRILLPADGEGRNSVYAAQMGWDVTAFDYSISGKKKAESLADKKNVVFSYFTSSVEDFNYPTETFDCVALIYAHMIPDVRELLHSSVIKTLKPGGSLIFEGFHTDQLKNKSGGPKQAEMLFTEANLKEDFSGLTFTSFENIVTQLSEGEHHKGKASIIRFTAVK
jgi:2-polyprenyl-3-methyl-5-hydroxy-6-metoxy-1,4-benzoquinol methylase